LFNRITEADVLAENMLFATLDPTARISKLPHGAPIILSDTVGFISDLPTMLVAAFRATLEDVISADVILHVRDVSHGDTEAQAVDVTTILKDLGIDPDDQSRIIEVWNKADLLDEADRARLFEITQQRQKEIRPVLVSALTGEGITGLLSEIETRLARDTKTYHILIPSDDGALLHWLYENAEILERQDGDDGIIDTIIRIPPERETRLLLRCPKAERVEN
jgi:GTP-binding protein HflX